MSKVWEIKRNPKSLKFSVGGTFKVGEEVKVKVFKKLPIHWVNPMKVWMGKRVKICKIDDYRIFLYNDLKHWMWYESDFEKIEKEFLSDKDLML